MGGSITTNAVRDAYRPSAPSICDQDRRQPRVARAIGAGRLTFMKRTMPLNSYAVLGGTRRTVAAQRSLNV